MAENPERNKNPAGFYRTTLTLSQNSRHFERKMPAVGRKNYLNRALMNEMLSEKACFASAALCFGLLGFAKAWSAS